ncbi:MAG: hypothetical protein WCI79_02225 [Candidatus Saccharibacteria bacterium]
MSIMQTRDSFVNQNWARQSSLSNQIEIVGNTIKSHPFWEFPDDVVKNVKVPTNFSPRTPTEFLMLEYYVPCIGDNPFFWDRRNLDGHLNAFRQYVELIRGWEIRQWENLRKDQLHMGIFSSAEYVPGVRFIAFDYFGDLTQSSDDVYPAGSEVFTALMHHSNHWDSVSDLCVPAYRFRWKDKLCEELGEFNINLVIESTRPGHPMCRPYLSINGMAVDYYYGKGTNVPTVRELKPFEY